MEKAESVQDNNQIKPEQPNIGLNQQTEQQPSPTNPIQTNIYKQEEEKVNNMKKSSNPRCPYELKEHIDCLDTVGHWLNAEIEDISGDSVKVHFSGWGLKYDEYIEWNSKRLQKQWKRGNPFQMNNRLDVLDETDTWLEARVIAVEKDKIKIHYYNFSPKFDEWLPNDSDRIAEVGAHSKAFGAAKFRKYGGRITRVSKAVHIMDDEKFKKVLASDRNFVIVPVEGDGNCLFRSFSQQLYGTTEYHKKIRKFCMDYISLERDYFKNYIIGGDENFDEYVAIKSENGSWGDDVEIQALSEIYNRSIEIYAYSATPLRTFHESASSTNIPIRISYHGRSHYCSVKPAGKEKVGLLSTYIGLVEQAAIKNATLRAERNKELKESGGVGKIYDDDLLNEVQAARVKFDKLGEKDIELALEESLLLFEQQTGIETLTQQTVNASLQHQQQEEQAMIDAAIKASTLNQQQDDETQLALQISEMESLPQGVKQVVDAGFPLEYAKLAYEFVGDDPELITAYILENLIG